VCEGLSGSTSSATTLYQRGSLRISPDLSRYRPYEVELHFSGYGVNQAFGLLPSGSGVVLVSEKDQKNSQAVCLFSLRTL
jgi:hypothetical protein